MKHAPGHMTGKIMTASTGLAELGKSITCNNIKLKKFNLLNNSQIWAKFLKLVHPIGQHQGRYNNDMRTTVIIEQTCVFNKLYAIRIIFICLL